MWWAQSCSGLSDEKPRELQEVLTRDFTPFPSPAGHWKELCCKRRGQQLLATPHQCLGLWLYTKILELLLPISSPGRTGLQVVTALPPTQKELLCFSMLCWLAAHFPNTLGCFPHKSPRGPYNCKLVPLSVCACIAYLHLITCLNYHTSHRPATEL